MKKATITRRILSVLLSVVLLIGCIAISYGAFAATSISYVSLSVTGLSAGRVPSVNNCRSNTRGTGIVSLSTEVRSGNSFTKTTAPLEVGKSYRLMIEVETTGAYVFPELAVTATVNGDDLRTGVLWRSSYHITVVYGFTVTASLINRIAVSVPTLTVGGKSPLISDIYVSYGVEVYYLAQKKKMDNDIWANDTTPFESGNQYRLYFYIRPISNSYQFPVDKAQLSVEINGVAATIDNLTTSSVTVFYEFCLYDWVSVSNTSDGISEGDWFFDWIDYQSAQSLDDDEINRLKNAERFFVAPENEAIKIETKKEDDSWSESIYTSDSSAYNTYRPFIKQYQENTSPNNEEQNDHNDNEGSDSNGCPWCGKTHEGFFQGIVGFFHRIFARLFGAKY